MLQRRGIAAEIKRVDKKLDGMLKQQERAAFEDQKRTLKAIQKVKSATLKSIGAGIRPDKEL